MRRGPRAPAPAAEPASRQLAPRRIITAALWLAALAGCADPAGLTRGTAHIEASAGSPQTGAIGRGLPDSLEVTVTDFAGRPVERVPVSWATSDGRIAWGGVTDAEGHARAAWTLGLGLGEQHASASVLGLDPVGFVATGSGFRAAQLAGGGAHACALTDDHRVFCWQRDPGTPQLPLDTVPTLVEAGARFSRLVAGSAHTCGLTDAGVAWCWGRNDDGQLGDGTQVSRATPAPAAGGPWTALFSGSTAYATCALDTSSHAWCWGSLEGGYPPLSRVSLPTAVGGPAFRSLSVGFRHICGIGVSGGAWCWGFASDGAIGAGATTDTWTLVPTPVAGPTMDAVSAGAIQSCGISAARAYCWGGNFYSALGSPGDMLRYVPSPVAGNVPFSDLSLVVRGAYALDAHGLGYRWGSPGGCCDLSGPDEPTPLPGSVGLDTLVATGNGACGLMSGSHTVICWTPVGLDGLDVAAPPTGSPAPPAPSTPAAPGRIPPPFPSRPRK